jgi:hypothetical protein
LKEQQVWGTLGQAHDFGKRQTWEQSRSTLGHALGTDGYLTLAAAYNGLSAAADRASVESPGTKLSDEQGWAIASTFLALNRALSYLGLIVHAPSRWTPIARQKFRRAHQAFVEDNLKQDPKYQEFMAQHGARIKS